MKEAIAIVCDSVKESLKLSSHKLATADFVYCLQEDRFIKNRYGGSSQKATKQNKEIMVPEEISYWI